MSRFYIPPQCISQDKVIVDGPQAHHIANVLRLKIGDEVTLFDGSGYEYRSRIIRLQPGKLIAQVQARLKPVVESPLELVLGQALIKTDKLELVIQKATELGVSQIVPLRCARSRRISLELLARKVERWQKIAAEAAQQCGRVRLPQIGRLLGISEFCVNFSAAELKLIFWEQGEGGVKDMLTGAKQAHQVVLLIGPEGGFKPDEVQAAKEHGFTPLGLGPRTLRAETAAITALSLIQYQLGDLR